MRPVTLKIRCFDPDQDQRSYWATYTVDVDDQERLLDVLNTTKWTIDGSLTFRRSCMHGVCGSDAMCVNGHNRQPGNVLYDKSRRTDGLAWAIVALWRHMNIDALPRWGTQSSEGSGPLWQRDMRTKYISQQSLCLRDCQVKE